MTEPTYHCSRARVVGWWNCSCRECQQRQRANTLNPPQLIDKKSLTCPHGVPYRYSCEVCDSI